MASSERMEGAQPGAEGSLPVSVDTLPANTPPAFHLLAKPSGSTCNIDCTYCFFLSKEALYPNDTHRMSEATLETYIRQLLESHRTPQVTSPASVTRPAARQCRRLTATSACAAARSSSPATPRTCAAA